MDGSPGRGSPGGDRGPERRGGSGPRPTGVRTRRQFGARLEGLRRAADLSIRAAARRSGNPSSTVKDWCSGDRLPARGQDDRFRALLATLGVAGPDADALMVTLARLRDADSRRRPDGADPFPGLASFGPGDAEWFHGRKALVDHAVDRFRRLLADPDRRRLLWVAGASGAGKTSLLHAGMWPALEAGGRRVVAVTPGADPLGTLADVVAPVVGVDPATARTDLDADPAAFLAAVPRCRPGEVDVVVIVDQCEDALRGDPDSRDRFLAGLAALTEPTSTSGCAVVAGLRTESRAAVAGHPDLARSLRDAQVTVEPLTPAQLRDAIVEPARTAGFAVEDELVEVVRRDLVPTGAIGGRHDPGALPLLAHALRETWHRSPRREMSVGGYEAAGGIRGAIGVAAERVHDSFGPRSRELARQVLLRLVQVDDGGLAGRRVVPLAELEGLAAAGSADRRAVAAIVERFVDARLLTAGASGARAGATGTAGAAGATGATVAITHGSLLTAWPRLAGWIEDSRDALRLHRRIGDAARAWCDAGRDPTLLATGRRLEAMQAWAERDGAGLGLSRDEADFLAAGHERSRAAERADRRRARNVRLLVVVAFALAGLATALAVQLERALTDATTPAPGPPTPPAAEPEPTPP